MIYKQKVSTTKHNYYLQRMQHFASTLLIRKKPMNSITRIHNEIKTQHITYYKVMMLWRIASESSSLPKKKIEWSEKKTFAKDRERAKEREKEGKMWRIPCRWKYGAFALGLGRCCCCCFPILPEWLRFCIHLQHSVCRPDGRCEKVHHKVHAQLWRKIKLYLFRVSNM